MPLKYTGFLLDDAKATTKWRENADERVAEMKTFGANIFRICVYPDRSESGCDYVLAQNTIDICDKFADQAVRYGMICVFAVFLPGSDAGSKTGALWASTGLQASFGKMWKSFAQRYQGKPVWFDLLNEPVYHGSSMHYDEEPYVPIFQSWCDSIREVAHNVILWQPSPGAMAHCFNIGYNPPKVRGLVGSLHWYWPYNVTHNGVPTGEGFDARWVYPNRGPDQVLDIDVLKGQLDLTDNWVKKYQIPMVVGEFGCIRWAPEQSHVRYLADSVELFERYNWDGWMQCAWRCWYGWDPENEALDTPADPDFDVTHRYANPYWDAMSVLRRHMQMPVPPRVAERPPPGESTRTGPPTADEMAYRPRIIFEDRR